MKVDKNQRGMLRHVHMLQTIQLVFILLSYVKRWKAFVLVGTWLQQQREIYLFIFELKLFFQEERSRFLLRKSL